MPGDVRLVQLARMLQVTASELTNESARALIDERPVAFADALFQEAADSDDVTGIEPAIDYLEGRLSYFNGLISHQAAMQIRAEFRNRVSAWERLPR